MRRVAPAEVLRANAGRVDPRLVFLRARSEVAELDLEAELGELARELLEALAELLQFLDLAQFQFHARGLRHELQTP